MRQIDGGSRKQAGVERAGRGGGEVAARGREKVEESVEVVADEVVEEDVEFGDLNLVGFEAVFDGGDDVFDGEESVGAHGAAQFRDVEWFVWIGIRAVGFQML